MIAVCWLQLRWARFSVTVEVAVSVAALAEVALAAVASVVAVQEAASDRGKRYLIDIKITSTYNYEIDKDKQSADCHRCGNRFAGWMRFFAIQRHGEG